MSFKFSTLKNTLGKTCIFYHINFALLYVTRWVSMPFCRLHSILQYWLTPHAGNTSYLRTEVLGLVLMVISMLCAITAMIWSQASPVDKTSTNTTALSLLAGFIFLCHFFSISRPYLSQKQREAAKKEYSNGVFSFGILSYASLTFGGIAGLALLFNFNDVKFPNQPLTSYAVQTAFVLIAIVPAFTLMNLFASLYKEEINGSRVNVSLWGFFWHPFYILSPDRDYSVISLAWDPFDVELVKISTRFFNYNRYRIYFEIRSDDKITVNDDVNNEIAPTRWLSTNLCLAASHSDRQKIASSLALKKGIRSQFWMTSEDKRWLNTIHDSDEEKLAYALELFDTHKERDELLEYVLDRSQVSPLELLPYVPAEHQKTLLAKVGAI